MNLFLSFLIYPNHPKRDIVSLFPTIISWLDISFPNALSVTYCYATMDLFWNIKYVWKTNCRQRWKCSPSNHLFIIALELTAHSAPEVTQSQRSRRPKFTLSPPGETEIGRWKKKIFTLISWGYEIYMIVETCCFLKEAGLFLQGLVI